MTTLKVLEDAAEFGSGNTFLSTLAGVAAIGKLKFGLVFVTGFRRGALVSIPIFTPCFGGWGGSDLEKSGEDLVGESAADDTGEAGFFIMSTTGAGGVSPLRYSGVGGRARGAGVGACLKRSKTLAAGLLLVVAGVFWVVVSEAGFSLAADAAFGRIFRPGRPPTGTLFLGGGFNGSGTVAASSSAAAGSAAGTSAG